AALSRRMILRSSTGLASLALMAPLGSPSWAADADPAAAAEAAEAAAPAAFTFETLVERARAVAGAAYQPIEHNVPEALTELDSDQYRDIRFRPDRALWRDQGLPFPAQFFHLGFYFREPI